MKKSFIIPGMLLMSQTIFSQIKQDRNVSSFSKISVSNAVKVELTMGNQESLSVETDEDVMKNVKTEVKNNELKIFTEGNFTSEKGILVRVTAKNLSSIDISGASSLEAKDIIKADRLEFDVSGASKLKVEVKTEQLDVELSGASSARISGESEKIKSEVSGASSLKADDLKANDADISAEGAAKINIHAGKILNAKASGASSICYSGNPEKKNLNSHGASRISNVGDSETTKCTEKTYYDSNGNAYKVKSQTENKQEKTKIR